MMRSAAHAATAAILLLVAVPPAAGQASWSESYGAEAAFDYGRAIEPMDRILESDPGHEFALMRRGWLNYLAGRLNASIRDYQRALELNDQSLEARLGLMLPLLAQQRWRQAAAYGQEVLTEAPWNYYAHVRLLVAEEGQRQWGAMVRRAGSLAVRYPSDATARIYWARGLARQGQADEAADVYAEVLERAPQNEEALAFLAGDR